MKIDNRDSINPDGKRFRYHVSTFGCQMNDRDSEILAGMLERMGYEKTGEMNDSDIILLNTCCVRETAENKVWGRIGELKALKSQNPDLIIGVCGCMPQQPEVGEKIRRRAPHVDIIFGTHNMHQLPKLIDRVRAERKTVVDIWENEVDIVENLPSKRVAGVKASVTIMYGCNNFCTYCIVPFVRGRERSRNFPDIIREVGQLAGEGYKEVMLLGQNVNSYGKELKPPSDFADLLLALDKIDGLARIRYMTSHPRDFTDKLIEVIAESKKVCEQFHLPVQAGGNNVLKRMNRGYTKERYLELAAKIRAKIPWAGITTDLIVGFPGETDEDFAETLDLIQTVRFDAAFTFVYNKRSGTPAAEMPDQIPDEVKKSRIQKLIAVQNSISQEKNLAEVGRTHEVLVEGVNKGEPTLLEGRTRTNKMVLLRGEKDLIGQIVYVNIIESGTWHLDGELVARC
ncbi:MAG: tRNA (N6-isopentenyl adenosine(37)-C2)-methylthiotransferase MiaB [Firmicutes bacterium HGW-Firmicutes-8]|nr:MAG: tRNA (N6-isopentenyl adenosine(37)-C2)-methylthiotransferase MiaB [Firmicutes bacterium HGW-Firmicutes-8]